MAKAWRKRQSRDPYFRRAKAEGYRARSAYKLLQIQEKHGLISPGDAIVDLGAAPGGWSQVASELVGPQGRVVAVDLAEMESLSGVTVLQADMQGPETIPQIRAALGGTADVVLSDAAPQVTGIRVTDHARSIGLAEAALHIGSQVLRPGGHFVVKVFEGGDFPAYLRVVRGAFGSAKPYHPPASRQESRELFVVARSFRGSS
jgi:23S rRNA (uridine2552-2'-O)-methyltransferase